MFSTFCYFFILVNLVSSSTLFWQLRWRRRCLVLLVFAFPLYNISGVEWEGVQQKQRGSLIKACQDCALEKTLQRFLTKTAKHGKQWSTGYKSTLDWHEARCQALFLTEIGVIGSHWTATVRLTSNKVVSRNSSLALLGLWGLRILTLNHSLQTKQNNDE